MLQFFVHCVLADYDFPFICVTGVTGGDSHGGWGGTDGKCSGGGVF